MKGYWPVGPEPKRAGCNSQCEEVLGGCEKLWATGAKYFRPQVADFCMEIKEPCATLRGILQFCRIAQSVSRGPKFFAITPKFFVFPMGRIEKSATARAASIASSLLIIESVLA
jgi:hypothetical protein